MGLFSRLAAKVTAKAGTIPQIVTPVGWNLDLGGAAFVQNALTYSANMTPDLALGNWIVVTATNNTAFTINNPVMNGVALSATNTPVGALLIITLLNAVGGALGAVTLGSFYKGNGSFTANIANGTSISSVSIVVSSTQCIGLAPWNSAFAY